ncbi:sterile alpha motif domain-containing protein 9-like [Dendronephthya gigantea]|uniref:sterile alpha motif domain-containing protein 9-like n=1 Tax=Dendronephthya gigantea TaxID=151771 RepID=UPI00106B91A5|nr:sterile alpha motif domain-containing protein 9-like [Dendronephthya gigantea]
MESEEISDYSDLTAGQYEGQVLKRERNYKWTPYWCVLYGRQLTFYESSEKISVVGRIEIQPGSTCDKGQSTGEIAERFRRDYSKLSKYSLRLKTKKGTHLFTYENVKEQTRWQIAMNNASQINASGVRLSWIPTPFSIVNSPEAVEQKRLSLSRTPRDPNANIQQNTEEVQITTVSNFNSQLQSVEISCGAAIKFSKKWFSRKISDRNVSSDQSKEPAINAGVASTSESKDRKTLSENEKSSPSQFEGKIDDRRPFSKPGENYHYTKGNVLPNTEDKTFEYKALTGETALKLPWKIMERAKKFICGILNGGERGIIYFGIGDSYDKTTNYKRGEIIGLEVKGFRDEITQAYQRTLGDHIKSDNGKMTTGGDMNCINIHFVPVWESGKRTARYVIEIEVKREWMFCKDFVYYFQKWTEKREGRNSEKSGLHDLYKVEKDKWEDPAIRTCGSSESVKAIDTVKQVKEPLSQKYREWQENTKAKQQKEALNTREDLNIQTLSVNVRKSLRELNYKENSYILIANRVTPEYRGSNTISFLKKIPWIAVFDLFDLQTEKDGLYYILNETNDCLRPSMKYLDDFKDPKVNESILKVDTTWIVRTKEMHESSWTMFSKNSLYKALSAYSETPTGRVHCVFLVLSNDNLQEMADIVDSSFSIIGSDANKHISIITERKELGTQMVKSLKHDISKNVKPPCSIFGIQFNLLKDIIKGLLGPIGLDDPDATTELPYLARRLRPVLSKRIKSLTDLEVYIPHPDLSSELEDIKKAKESFYMGNAISQMNLFHKDAIERTLETKLIRCIDEHLQELQNFSSDMETVEQYTETVTLNYESGSGATTLGRQILWKKKEEYRCAVVKKISEKTEYQISQLQKFLYETLDTNPAHIPPVLILVDNFPEKQVHHLSDLLSKNKTKCVLLTTTPLDKSTGNQANDFTLGKLDNTEIDRVRGVLSTLESERAKEAVKVLDRERRFVWLGLELFGRKYAEIKPRLSKHILQVLSRSLNDQLNDAYEMILQFCCLLYYYSKRRAIYPQPCVEEILYYRGGLKTNEERKIDKIHDKFGGILLDERNESVGYHGWRPAHSLVGEVVREEIDLFKTAKKMVEEMNTGLGRAYVWKFLIDDTVSVLLQRDMIAENPSDIENEGIEDEFLEIPEVRTKYSQLILDILPNQEDQHVKNALDLLITLSEEVTTIHHKAHTLQQIARMFAYEIGMNCIPKEIFPLVERVNVIINRDNSSIVSPEIGFDIAHRVIDEATKLQQSYIHHLVTKATFYRLKLKYLYHNNGHDINELKLVIEEAINTTKKGIDLYENALKDKNRDSYLYGIIGKIQTIVVLVMMFKKLPFFAQHPNGQDESFKRYVTFKKNPDELGTVITEENNDYFISLLNTAVQLLNDFLGEIQIRRKLSYKAHERKKLENAKIRAMKLRTRFYEVTNLDRTNFDQGVVLNEEIVNDLLYKNHESPFSSWMRLTPDIIENIYQLLSNAIPNETSSHNAMLTCAKAALQQYNTFDSLSQLVKEWCKKYPDSEWAHMFSYMLHFPVPNGSLKTDVAVVKSSVAVCRKRFQGSNPGYRRSGAEYLLGKGIGLKSIIPPHHVVSQDADEPKIAISRSRYVKLETEFWRSKIVYEKLERLSGKKNLQKRGVLDYRGIEIPFDNDRYPHESRDELWFCLGFTITGPYAYDPIDKDTYNEIREKFKNDDARGLPQKNGSSKGPSHAWQFGDSHKKSVLASKAKTAIRKQIATPNPGNNGRKEIHRTAATGSQALQQKGENHKTFEKSLMTGAAMSSRDPQQNTSSMEEAWKKNTNFRKRTVKTKEGEKDFPPKYIDPKTGRVHHGAQVQGAPKSVECLKHKSSSKETFSKSCTFAHTWRNDPVVQTICDHCTNNGLHFCNKKEHKERYHYNLGQFLIAK